MSLFAVVSILIIAIINLLIVVLTSEESGASGRTVIEGSA